LLGDPGKCKGLHGHTAKAAITIKADGLDELGMVCHFDELKKKIGTWIEENLDHRMLLSKNDPLCDVLKEHDERVVMLEENPTAEYLAKHIFDRCKEDGLSVTKVEVWESPTSKASYY
jgi:6-pyruvoyltetrahydropterin/6-carboxytetrahydropterin synthase